MRITQSQIGDVLIHAQSGERVRVVNVFTVEHGGVNVRAADCETGGEIFRIYASAGGLGDPDVWRRVGGQS